MFKHTVEIQMSSAVMAEKVSHLQALVNDLTILADEYPGFSERLRALAYEASENILEIISESMGL
jgi:antibiotic biosynthesis monooxygenase (ABM) superfamily enzyme